MAYHLKMGTDYTAQQFASAIYSIVTSAVTTTPQDRVYSAAMSTHNLFRDDFTPELWQRFTKFRMVVTRVDDEKGGSFRASANVLTDMEAHDILVDFYNLAQAVEEEYRCSNAN